MTHERTFDLDHSLCPMQVLEMYLEHVSAFRGSQRCLFLNLVPAATKEMHADCITNWVHSVVTDTYASAKGVALPEGEIWLVEMHAFASSW